MGSSWFVDAAAAHVVLETVLGAHVVGTTCFLRSDPSFFPARFGPNDRYTWSEITSINGRKEMGLHGVKQPYL